MIDGSVRPQRSELLVCVCVCAWLVLTPRCGRIGWLRMAWRCVCVFVCEVAEVRVLLSAAARLFPVPTTRLTRTRCVFT